MNRIISLGIISIWLFSGCAWFQAKDEKSSKELTENGMIYFEEGKYRKSIESFEKLKDWYPFSKYASLAELKTADAHYRLKEYDQAILFYEEFESLHPRNEAIPYVIYQTGNCYFERMDTFDRDQTVVKKALDTYKRLIKQFPDDVYAKKSRDRILSCQKSLTEHEFRVGLFYYKSKHYEPAMYRFKYLLSNYPDTGIHEKALYYIALCENFIKKNAQK